VSAKISFRAVSRRFAHQGASFLALDRLSVDVADGEFVTLVGRRVAANRRRSPSPPA